MSLTDSLADHLQRADQIDRDTYALAIARRMLDVSKAYLADEGITTREWRLKHKVLWSLAEGNQVALRVIELLTPEPVVQAMCKADFDDECEVL